MAIINQFIGDKEISAEGVVVGTFITLFQQSILLVMVTPEVGYLCRHFTIDNSKMMMTGIIIPTHEFNLLNCTLHTEETDFVNNILSSING